MQAGRGQEYELVRRAAGMLESQSGKPPDMEHLAASLGMSRSPFFRVFKEHTGLSPYQYHLELRIARAKEMLQGTVMPVKEIAFALGFENAFHFSNHFHERTGKSPSQWRQAGRPR